jgi:hypothetical protein
MDGMDEEDGAWRKLGKMGDGARAEESIIRAVW